MKVIIQNEKGLEKVLGGMGRGWVRCGERNLDLRLFQSFGSMTGSRSQ
jgi:hypothetical protein